MTEDFGAYAAAMYDACREWLQPVSGHGVAYHASMAVDVARRIERGALAVHVALTPGNATLYRLCLVPVREGVPVVTDKTVGANAQEERTTYAQAEYLATWPGHFGIAVPPYMVHPSYLRTAAPNLSEGCVPHLATFFTLLNLEIGPRQ